MIDPNKQKEQQGSGLDFLAQDRSRLDVGSVGLRSRIVRGLTYVLPLSALSLMAVLLLWSDMESPLSSLSFEDIEIPEAGQNELIMPRFESRDDRSQPFTVTAKKAVTKDGNKSLIYLESPLADMVMSDGGWVAIDAQHGEYDQERQYLFLSGDVKLFHNEGYQLHSDELSVSVKDQVVQSDLPVYGQGPTGKIDAKGVRAEGESGNLIFYGPAKLTLYNGMNLPDTQQETR